MKRPLLLGHRGQRLPGGPAENTLQAFEHALAAGCDGIEFDVRLSADAVPVIVHDPEYRGLVVGQTPAGKLNLPTLSDVLARFAGRAFLDIELKASGIGQQTAELLSQYNFERGVLVSSFLPSVLEDLHASDASLPLGLIFDHPDKIDLWRELPLAYVIPHHFLVTQALISSVHAQGKKLLTWTVNRTEDMLRLAQGGVDGIVSDNPRALVATFAI